MLVVRPMTPPPLHAGAANLIIVGRLLEPTRGIDVCHFCIIVVHLRLLALINLEHRLVVMDDQPNWQGYGHLKRC